MRYLHLSATGEAPPFQASFRPPGDSPPVEYSSAGLKGRVVLLVFWRATAAQRRLIEALADDVAAYETDHPEVKGRYQILGVNLDTDPVLFHRARAQWRLPWPQCHEGAGFESTVAQGFAIPRVPHWAVLSPAGNLVALTGNRDAFSSRFTAEMERLRSHEGDKARRARDRN